jgi:hypothetical protein
MAIRYSEKYEKNYESRVDKIILNSALYKTKGNIFIKNNNNNMSIKQNISDSYKRKGVSLISYFN